jgi:hypothetical protein
MEDDNLLNVDPDADRIERAIASGIVVHPSTARPHAMVRVPSTPPSAEATAQDAPVQRIYLPTFAPGSVALPAATRVNVSGNDERLGIDVRMQVIQASTVHVRIASALDSGQTVRAVLVRTDAVIDRPFRSSVEPDGLIRFAGVPPGTYTLYGETTPAYTGRDAAPPAGQPGPQARWGSTALAVAGPLTSVMLPLQPSRSVSGVVMFDMERRPDLIRTSFMVHVIRAGADGGWLAHPQARIAADGRFTITDVPGGPFSLRVYGAPMKSAIIGNQDTLDFPIEFAGDRDITDAVITLTDKPSLLSGTLRDIGGAPACDYAIVVASSDPRYWTAGSRRVAVAHPDADGRYALSNLPAGSYQIGAVADFEEGAQFDPEFLRTLQRGAVLVTIGDGARVTQDLRVRPRLSPDRVELPLQRLAIERLQRQAGEPRDACVEFPECGLEGAEPLVIGSIDRGRILETPMRGDRLAWPDRTDFPGGVIADREHEVERRRTCSRELVPALAA